MSNARTLASLIDDTNTRIKIPSGYGLDFADYGAEDSNSNTTVGNNLMDDYEEGTWTPTMSSGSVTIDTANYIKIGRQVHLHAYLVDITDSSTNATVVINNLPFTSSGPQRAVGSIMVRYLAYPDITNLAQITPFINTSTNTISLYMSLHTPSTTPYNWAALKYQDTAGVDWDMILSITYLTD